MNYNSEEAAERRDYWIDHCINIFFIQNHDFFDGAGVSNEL